MLLSENRGIELSLNQKAEREIGRYYSLNWKPPFLLFRSAAPPSALKILTRQIDSHWVERACVR
jgi:hypothetical protein